jgi:hypothetical protein
MINLKRNKKTDNAILEFAKMAIDNPELLEDSENAQKIAYDVLQKNKNITKDNNEEKERA